MALLDAPGCIHVEDFTVGGAGGYLYNTCGTFHPAVPNEVRQSTGSQDKSEGSSGD